ncbi:MAG TPA: helix-turn-helix domain-containing protein [Solirubrobacterales bacterium]
MHDGIGSTLREARKRRKVDLSEVEATTKIRLRHLQAIENEEWDALPGGPYTRGFIRTYGAFLGLDGERLADEYRRSAAPGGGERPTRVEPRAVEARAPRRAPRLSNRAWTALVSLGLLAVLVVAGLAGGGGNGGSPSPGPGAGKTHRAHGGNGFRDAAARPGVAVEVSARAEVWVCLLDATGRRLIDGRILAAGDEAGPFRSSRFTVSFGNGEVEMRVDGRSAGIPASSSPLGYAVGSGGALRPLSEAERPTCA